MVINESNVESDFSEKVLNETQSNDLIKTTQQYPDNYIIDWEDEKMEQLMKECLDKEQITYADVKNITALYIYSDKILINDNDNSNYIARYRKINENISLNDLKYFDSLLKLRIYNYESINCDIFEDESFSDRLYALDICVKLNSEQIVQISKMSNLKGLLIEQNELSINDLEVLSTLEDLYQLILWNDTITDISPLSNLKQLIYLDISDNNISNIEALRNLEILERVILTGNKITDYSPVSHVKEVIKTPEELLKYFDSEL